MDSKEGEEIESKEEPKDIDQEKVASNAEGGDKDGSTIGDDDMPQGSTAGEYDPNHPQSEQTAQAQGEEKTPVKNKEEGGEEEPAENPISPTEDENIAEDATSKQEGGEEPPVTEEKAPTKSPTPEGDEAAIAQTTKPTESDPVPVVAASDTKETDGGEQGEEEEEGEEEERSYEYNYDSMYSRPTVVEMEDNTLQLLHSFGYECQKRSNLIALDHQNLMYAAGNVLVLFDLTTRKYTHLRTLGGGGIGAITLHPSREYFAVGEKGDNPVIAIYCYPSLKLYRILREGTEQQYSHMDFNPREGDLLASVGGYPDYMLTVWEWESESVILRSKAFSQDIYRVSFSPELPGQLTTSGTGHIRFWKMALTFTGLKLQGYLGKFGKTELTDIAAYVELPDGKVLSGSEWGNMLLWDGGFIKVELAKKGKKFCHNGVIEVLYLDEGEVVSAGADGFIRIWNFESIDNADANENNIPYEIEPLTEIKVGSDVNLKSLCRSNDPDMPTIWYGQDANGAIWKLDIVASHTRKPSEKLVSYHSGEVCSIDCSPDAHLAGSIGEDGSVRVCRFESSEILCHVKYPGGGSSLIWAPLSVDASGLTLVAGFTDGVVRILKIDKDSLVSKSHVSHRKGVPGGKLILVNVSKPHTLPVTAMAIDHEGKLLATASEDSTVFFIDLKNKFLPIGYVKVSAPVSCITWSQPNQGLLRLLVCCKDGSMAEISAPIGEYDTSQSYHLESVSVSSRKFVSIKDRLRKEEADAIKEAERERKKKKKEAAKKARREKRKAEMGDSYRSEDEEEEEENEGEVQGEEGEQEDEKKDKSDGPSSIHSVFYEHGEPNNFWISVGGYDAGYLYRGSLEGSGNINEPYETPHTVPVPKLHDKDVPIHSMMFNKSGEYLLTGTEDGCVRVYRLYSPYSLTALDRHWTLRIHDNHYGQVKTMSLSYDNQYLVTGGADGNIFIHKAELPPASKYARLDTKLTPGTQVVHEPKDPIRDINDTSHYSIEDAKRKEEHDRMMKAADEKKQQVRREISKLRREFTQLQQRSTRLPAHLRLGQQEFVMDPSMSAQLQQQLLDKVELVRREMAWDSEKEKIALDKLKTRYKDCIECDRIVVYGVRNRQNVSSFRTAFPSTQFLEIMEKVSSTEVNLTPWTAQGSDQKGPSRRNTKHVIETGAKPDQLLEETDERKELTKSEARRLKKDKRKREWEELLKIKPGDNFEDPREVEAIEKAKREMGDYKLKSSSDFVVSEDQRTSTDKKRKELVLCRNTILETKRSFNSKLKSLRDEKLTMIDKIKELVKQLKEKQKNLPLVMRKPVPRVPKINPEEVPEREFEYTKDTLLKFKADLEKREAAEKQAQAGGEGFGGFGGFGGDQQEGVEEEEEEGEQETVSGSSSTLHSSSINVAREDQSTLSDMERLMASEQEMTLLHQQDCILREVDRLIEEFDKRVLHLRHDRGLEEIKIKSAEIKHLTQFEEMELLKEFEKRESTFTSKYRAKKQEKVDLEVKIEEAEWSVKEKESLYQNLTEQQKALDQNFTESVGENNKFKEFLMKVYRKKIKRTKLKTHQDTGEEGRENEQDEEEEESDSDSDWSSEDESDEEGFDDSVCPPGCDQTLFDLAIDMREKRMDLEELLAEEKKSLDGVKRELDSFTKKAKTIDTHVKTALQELQAFQLKKQQRINELDAVVVLKLHQILHYQQGGAPPANVAQCLVFPASAREHLANRIGELVHEKQHEKKRYRELRQHHVRLVRERKEMEKKVAILNEKANEIMRLKFGRIVNLDALEGLTTNKMIGELEESLQTEQMKHDIAMARVEGSINNTRQELLSIVRKNTNKTNKLHELTTRSRQLEQGLNIRQRSTEGSEASSYNPFEPEEKARLLQIVQIQNQEIQALRDEIKILSLKGGKLLPPPQAPGAMAESTMG